MPTRYQYLWYGPVFLGTQLFMRLKCIYKNLTVILYFRLAWFVVGRIWTRDSYSQWSLQADKLTTTPLDQISISFLKLLFEFSCVEVSLVKIFAAITVRWIVLLEMDYKCQNVIFYHSWVIDKICEFIYNQIILTEREACY